MARNSLKGICRLIDQANEKLSPEQSFLNDLKKSIEMTAEGEKRKPSMTYKPSSMKCIRNMYYQRTGAEPDEELSSYCSVGICNSGNIIFHIFAPSYGSTILCKTQDENRHILYGEVIICKLFKITGYCTKFPKREEIQIQWYCWCCNEG